METLAGFPYFPLEFDKAGTPNQAQEAALSSALENALASSTDLLVLCHGWNNDMAEARHLYETLLSNMGPRLLARHPRGAGRGFAVLGIFWPSKKFADAALIPDGGAGAGAAAGLGESGVPMEALHAAAIRFGEMIDADAAQVAALQEHADAIGDGPAAKRRFVDAVRALLPPSSDPEDGSDALFGTDGEDVIDALEAPVAIVPPEGDEGGATNLGPMTPPSGEAEGAAADLGSFFAGVKAAALRLLNYATYYVMKERAGTIGTALNIVLGRVRNRRPALALHLIGHSFGGRLATAAVDGPDTIAPASLSLLQAAFSHNGFCANIRGRPGFFRNVVAQGKVAGPILVTHSANDRAVGIAYALASRLAGDNAAAVGGPGDQFGGLGRNGAMLMADTERVTGELKADDFAYPAFPAGVIQNLKAEAFIADHSDITNAAVANAIVHAMG